MSGFEPAVAGLELIELGKKTYKKVTDIYGQLHSLPTNIDSICSEIVLRSIEFDKNVDKLLNTVGLNIDHLYALSDEQLPNFLAGDRQIRRLEPVLGGLFPNFLLRIQMNRRTPSKILDTVRVSRMATIFDAVVATSASHEELNHH